MQEERDAEDARIARLRGTELMAAMQDGTLTSERAVAAFCRRANAIGNVKTKGVTEEFYDEAVQAAKVVDEKSNEQRRGGGGDGGGNAAASTGGLLQGMPISIKDAMNMKGAVSKQASARSWLVAVFRDTPTSLLLERMIICCALKYRKCGSGAGLVCG